MNTPRSTSLWRNAVTLTGAIGVVISALFIIAFLALDVLSAHASPYIGLFTFFVFPCVLISGVGLMFVGIYLARRRHRQQHGNGVSVRRFPRINLNVPQHQRSVIIFLAIVAAALPVVGLLSYEGYHFAESNEFCGQVCHTVMGPQHATHDLSPHARVGCSECHVGPGASSFVKAKLSGVRQLLSVATDSFPRPIPPAIQALRPATETCRQCHWAAKYFGEQLVTTQHFASDESNTRSELRMFLKTGGSDKSTGPPSGIHWHMTLGHTIEYVALDDRLQDIPWVRTVDHNSGVEHIYRSDGLPATDPPPTGARRTVDCMDCHNRPAHMFRSPDRAVDVALEVNAKLRSLPFAKQQAVQALVRPYESKADGLERVPRAIEAYYTEHWPNVWSSRRGDIEVLKTEATDIYRSNFFPEMNVNWRTYPDNIGHKIFAGCFRCHAGEHVDAKGNTIGHACSICHEFDGHRTADPSSALSPMAGFVHTPQLEGIHSTLRCDKCHMGGVSPQPTCQGCHSQQQGFRAGTLLGFTAFDLPADPMVAIVDCDGCHDLLEPTNIESIDTACTDCHEDEESRFDGMLSAWSQEVVELLQTAEAHTDARGRTILDALRAAGPMHNIEATRAITKSLIQDAKPSPSP